MYAYLYGRELLKPDHRNVLAQIEQRLVDFGIQGKIYRSRTLQDPNGMLTEAYRLGARTFIAVGGDSVAGSLIDWASGKSDITVGFLPLQTGGTIAAPLGIPAGEAACQVLARRMIERVDIGKVGTMYFLSRVEMRSTSPLALLINGRATVRIAKGDTVILDNFAGLGNPHDGSMHLRVIAPHERGSIFSWTFFHPRPSHESRFPVSKVTLQSSVHATATLDGSRTCDSFDMCEVVPRRLAVIVGSKRAF